MGELLQLCKLQLPKLEMEKDLYTSQIWVRSQCNNPVEFGPEKGFTKWYFLSFFFLLLLEVSRLVLWSSLCAGDKAGRESHQSRWKLRAREDCCGLDAARRQG